MVTILDYRYKQGGKGLHSKIKKKEKKICGVLLNTQQKTHNRKWIDLFLDNFQKLFQETNTKQIFISIGEFLPRRATSQTMNQLYKKYWEFCNFFQKKSCIVCVSFLKSVVGRTCNKRDDATDIFWCFFPTHLFVFGFLFAIG
jgi:fatty-acid desaturase